MPLWKTYMRSQYYVAMSILFGLSVTSCRKVQEARRATPIRSRILHMISPSPQESQIIPLYMSNRRMLVMLRVGHSGSIPVVFDTGTSANLLDLELADVVGWTIWPMTPR